MFLIIAFEMNNEQTRAVNIIYFDILVFKLWFTNSTFTCLSHTSQNKFENERCLSLNIVG